MALTTPRGSISRPWSISNWSLEQMFRNKVRDRHLTFKFETIRTSPHAIYKNYKNELCTIFRRTSTCNVTGAYAKLPFWEIQNNFAFEIFFSRSSLNTTCISVKYLDVLDRPEHKNGEKWLLHRWVGKIGLQNTFSVRILSESVWHN